MTKTALLLGLAVLAGIGPATAQPSDAVAEAPHFMMLTGKQALADAFVERMRLVGMAMLGNGGLSFSDRAELTDKLIMPELRGAEPDLLAQWTAVYANALSADDMKAAEAFYATPAGQHLLASDVQISNSLQVVSLTWQTATLRNAISKHLDALQARGYLQ